MAVFKLLTSIAVLGTVVQCQDGGVYTAYSPGQYGTGGLYRTAPRLVPVKVRASASRLAPTSASSYSYHPFYSNLHKAQTYQRQYENYRQQPSMTSGYYRPTRQYYNGYEAQPQLQYRHSTLAASPTHNPGVVLKRGRVLAAPSPYAGQLSSPAYEQDGKVQYTNFPQQSASYPRAVVPQPQHQTQTRPVIQYQPQIQHSPLPQVQQVHQPQQPAYYLQKAPVAAAPRPLKAVRGGKLRQQVEAEPEEEEYPGDPNPQYNFSFDIKDDELTNYQNRQEERDGQTIKGSYSVVDPDGYVRTVTYTADPKNGFLAKVTREPTDVKIKFPVPTEAPVQKTAGPGRGQSYNPHQVQYQPQYQAATTYQSPQQQQYAAQPTYGSIRASSGRLATRY